MDVPDGTLFGLKFLLTSARYRKRVISYIRDPVVADFWRTDFETHMPEREQRERTLSTLNKIGAMIADPAIRAVIGQPRSRIDLSAILANGGILIASLPQGQLGVEKSALVGSLLMSQLHLAALSRPVSDRGPFHIYVGAATLPEMLSGIRKFGVSLVLANQYLDQLSPRLKAALVGTAGTLIAFRIGAIDAELIEPEFHLTNDDWSLCELAPFEAYVRTGHQTHRLTMPEADHPIYPSAPSRIRKFARAQYALPRAQVEARLARFIANT